MDFSTAQSLCFYAKLGAITFIMYVCTSMFVNVKNSKIFLKITIAHHLPLLRGTLKHTISLGPSLIPASRSSYLATALCLRFGPPADHV